MPNIIGIGGVAQHRLTRFDTISRVSAVTSVDVPLRCTAKQP